MGSKSLISLVIGLLLATASMNDLVAVGPASSAESSGQIQYEIYPLALRYKKQLHERIELPAVTAVTTAPDLLHSSSSEWIGETPPHSFLLSGGTDLLYTLMSLQR